MLASILVNHLLRDIFFEADRRCASWATIRASPAASVTSTVRIVGTRATGMILRNGVFDDGLLDLSIRLSPWRRLASSTAKYQKENNAG